MTFLQKVSFDEVVVNQLLNSCSTFPEFLNKLLDMGNISQKALADATGISEPTVSRMCRFSHKGNPHIRSIGKVLSICGYFQIYGETRERVVHLAFGVFEVWEEIDAKKLNNTEANILLYDKGYLLLGE